MFRTIILTVIVIAAALGGGVASVWYALETNDSFGAVNVGSWTAYPQAGTPDADPYSTARRARDAELPLGQSEGLPFFAKTDAQGARLSGRCNYVVDGLVPPARFWTLHTADNSLVSGAGRSFRATATHSRKILRRSDGSFSIFIGPDPMPGNWISVSSSDPIILVLTLYDTPFTGSADVDAQGFPKITRARCRG